MNSAKPTLIILNGVMGKKFGRKWRLYVNIPNDALRLIDANRPGVFQWIRNNLAAYESYRVTCEFNNGVVDDLNDKEYEVANGVRKITFTPLVTGSGGSGGSIMKMVMGVALIAVGFFFPPSAAMGASMMMSGAILFLGGMVEMITATPQKGNDNAKKDRTNHYFDGPVNTIHQGVPVQLIYGKRVLVGSHPISVGYTVKEDVVA